MKGTHNGTSMVMDILRYGALCVLPLLAANGLAATVTFTQNSAGAYRAECYQTNQAALTACNSDKQYETDSAMQCPASTLGYQLRRVGAGANNDVLYKDYYSQQQTTLCDEHFRREQDNQDSIVLLDQDLATAETNIINLQNRLTGYETVEIQVNSNKQSILDIGADINANTVGRTAHETRLNTIDSTLVTIDGQLVDLSNVDALIQSDVGALQVGQGNLTINSGVNSSLISANTQLALDVQAQQQTYEATRAAADAQSNSLLGTINANITTTNFLQQDTKNNLVTINDNITTSNFLSQDTNTLLTSVRDSQISTEAGVNNSNSLMTQIRDSTFSQEGIAATANTIMNDLRASQISTEGGVNNINNSQAVTNVKLDELKTAVEGISFDISGTNINIDNTGVESRLDSLQNTLDTFDDAPVTNTPIQRAIQDSQKATYDGLVQVPIVAAFHSLGTVWTGNTSTFACPQPSIDLTGTIIGTSVTFGMHCSLINQNMALLEIIIKLAWAFTAIMLFFRG